MDRALILKHLGETERHLVESEEHLVQQRIRINQLEREGHDTKLALQLLETFEQTRRLCVAERLRILAELDRVDGERLSGVEMSAAPTERNP